MPILSVFAKVEKITAIILLKTEQKMNTEDEELEDDAVTEDVEEAEQEYELEENYI